ncbi:hypothetical protein BD410DRAFT_154602 [Rickenella mellea]|uniref:Uncharacterized protein n=1 Tax=Rickenella mellea TaxID=50990 RepID=A0A4Y7PIW9_9AGAM|nr:hypothetical protein BD410DRAFT_154602 [Rickenella mellea]
MQCRSWCGLSCSRTAASGPNAGKIPTPTVAPAPHKSIRSQQPLAPTQHGFRAAQRQRGPIAQSLLSRLLSQLSSVFKSPNVLYLFALVVPLCVSFEGAHGRRGVGRGVPRELFGQRGRVFTRQTWYGKPHHIHRRRLPSRNFSGILICVRVRISASLQQRRRLSNPLLTSSCRSARVLSMLICTHQRT